MIQRYQCLERTRSAASVLAVLGCMTLGAFPAVAGGSQELAAGHAFLSATGAVIGGTSLLERPARLDVRLVPLRQALDELHASSGVPVAYSSRLLPADRLVSCDCMAVSVGDAMTRLLSGTDLEATVAAQQVVVRVRGTAPTQFGPSASHALALSVFEPVAQPLSPAVRSSRPAESRTTVALRQGTVTGQVTHGDTGEPIGAVQISVQGTGLGVVSGADGTFTIANVPAGTHTVVAQRLGFQPVQQAGVVVTEGAAVTVNLVLRPQVLALQEIVATGLVDPVEGVRSPIAVARVSRDMMPVTVAGNAIQNLQGMVAGLNVSRASGQPGEELTMMLRTPTSIRGTGAPLIVVDGIILGGGGTQSTIDIEGMDIESFEVIRGAAAASLYGSRAAAGVIAITTSRGSGLDLGQTRFTARSEIGVNQALKYNYLAQHHHFLMDPTNSFYVDANGNPVDRNNRVSPPLTQAFLDKPFPGPTYNNVDAIAQPGGFRQNSFSVSGNSAQTNFAVSLNNLQEQGALANNDGYFRNTFRINLDHRFMDALSLGVSLYHSRAGRDELIGNVFNLAVQAPIDVDFSRKGPDGQYLQQPDPTIAVQNPLWTQATRDSERRDNRTMASGSLMWNPVSWLSLSGTVGYDRADRTTRFYVPKGTPANVGSADEELDGELSLTNAISDTWNAEAQVSLRRDFGLLNVRTTVRGLVEYDREEGGSRSGQGFVLYGVPQLSNIPVENRNATTFEEERRAVGYLWDTAFDYDGKYILSALVRRDGSSLFGPDNRWHNYYRVAGAWRLGEEDWFNLPNVSEFKLSFARGTAGGRPNQTAQYETWTLTAGIPTKGSLGNRMLRPEHTVENELSLNMIMYDRIGIVLTHARQTTTDQLTEAPVSIVTGYTSQWVNAGTISGHTTELQIEGQMIQRPNFGWTTMLVGDYSNATITDWPIPCDATLAWRLFCTGEPVFGLFALHLVNGANDGLEGALAKHRGGDALPYINQFQVNDEGFVVWVGEGNTYQDGIAKNLWGTESGDIGGRTYEWGHPIVEQDAAGNNYRQLLGEGAPLGVGWVNSVRYGALTFHAHLHASVGGDANNRATWSLINSRQVRTMDSAHKPDGLKKPISYYQAAIAGNTDYYLDDASYLKLRTLSVNYQLSQSRRAQFGLDRIGVQNLSVGFIARNVFTLTRFSGFDPEGALNLATRSNSIGVTYPTTRSLTGEISVTF